MTTSSTSSLGIGGGVFDVQGTVNALMGIEQRSMARLNERESTTNVSISALGELKSKVDAAYSAVDALRSPTLLNGRSAASSATEVAEVSVSNAFAATVNNYDLNVSRLASAQRSTFVGFNSKTAQMGAGNGANQLTIEIPASSLLADNATAVTKSFSLQGKSLTDLLQEINNDNDLKNRVSGSLVNTNGAAGWALVLSGLKTGDDARFVATWDSDPTLTENLTSVKSISGFRSATASGVVDYSGGFSPAAGGNTINITIPAGSSLSDGTAISESISLLTADAPFSAIAPGMRSLTSVRDAINNNANLTGKVTAHVVHQGGNQGWALVVRGATAASDASFELTWDAELEVQSDLTNTLGARAVSAAPLAGISDVSSSTYNAADKAFVNGGATAALDAQATLNGLVVESANNTFSEAIAGVTVSVKKTGSASLRVADKREGIKSAVGALASALSALNTRTLELTRPGNDKTKAGPLASNSGVLSLQSAVMSSYVSGFTLSASPTTQRSWSLLGLEVQRDGSVSVNSARLDEFLSGTGGLSVAEAASFGSGAAMLSNGFSTSALATMLNTFRGTTGSLQSTLDYMNVSKQSLAREKTAETARLERTRAALVRKYSAVDAQLTKMNQMRSNIGAALSRVAG